MVQMLKKLMIFGLLCVQTFQLFSLQVVRDISALREGPAVFFDARTYLGTGTDLKRLSESEDGLWTEVRAGSETGWIASTAIGDDHANGSVAAFETGVASDTDPFGNYPFGGGLQIVTPGSYAAAVKGFAENYARSNGHKTPDMEPLLKMTEFTVREYRKMRRQLGLNEVPRRKKFINGENPTVTTQMEKVGMAVSMAVLADGVVNDPIQTKKINIIANALNNQTRNYATRIRCWILPDTRPASFSAPAGYIFVTRGLLTMLDNDDQLTAVIAHELGHLAIGHGSKDLQTQQIYNTAVDSVARMESAIREMGGSTDDSSADLRKEADRAFVGIKDVMDDQQEYEADAFSVKLIRRNGINKKALKQVLQKIMYTAIGKEPRYATQMQNRIKKI